MTEDVKQYQPVLGQQNHGQARSMSICAGRVKDIGNWYSPDFLNSVLDAAHDHYAAQITAMAEQLRQATEARDAAEAKLNSPELIDFATAVVQEASHQRVRWPSEHDAGKGPADWLWLVGVLAGRALDHHKSANMWDGEESAYHREKAVHHCITAAAALANWHAHVLGLHTGMRPGMHASGLDSFEKP